MAQTFAQYLINKSLPPTIQVTKPVTASVLKDVLTKVHTLYPDKYDDIVTTLKRLGDKFSTFEGISFGIKEIEVPNKAKRDDLLKKYQKLIDNSKSYEETIKYLGEAQKHIVANDTEGRTDHATLLVKDSGAISGKKTQLVKLRSTPVVVSGYDGSVVPELFCKSYSEGQDPFHHWLQSVETRKNLIDGQTQTSSPGELSKILHNVLAPSVVSTRDCGTNQGILLSTTDDIVGRYPAVSYPGYGLDTETPITESKKQDLIHKGVQRILVRSPQTCEAQGGTVCSKCLGLGISTAKEHPIGTHAGFISAGNMAEPLTQMTLSSKHSTTMAKLDNSLRGDKGFRQLVGMPKEYPNQKIYCEVYGKIFQILKAPQGGINFIVRTSGSMKVPDRFIEQAVPYPKLGKDVYLYFIPPNRTPVKAIKVGTEVYPGMPLSDGIDNLKDISRLRGLGLTRTVAAEEMRNVYKNTGVTIDRRHFELLSRAGHFHVRVERAPKGFMYHRGEVIEYPEFEKALQVLPGTFKAPEAALGETLLQAYNDVTAGTMVTPPVVKHLQEMEVTQVKTTKDLEVSTTTSPLQRVVNKSKDWLAALNHRHLKQGIIDAASTGKISNVHGHNPITAYAVGTEIGTGEQGEY